MTSMWLKFLFIVPKTNNEINSLLNHKEIVFIWYNKAFSSFSSKKIAFCCFSWLLWGKMKVSLNNGQLTVENWQRNAENKMLTHEWYLHADDADFKDKYWNG